MSGFSSVLSLHLQIRLQICRWLFDRLVESPHKTSFYARNLEEDLGDDENMQEAAKYWYALSPWLYASLMVSFEVQRSSHCTSQAVSLRNGGGM